MSIVVPLVVCRTGCVERITTARTAGEFVDNAFSLEAAYRPLVDLEDLRNTTRITVVGLTDDRRPVTRAKAVEIQQPVQIAVQRMVHPTRVDLIDALVRLWEEIKSCLEVNPPAGWSWVETRSLKDENGLPYEFSRLRDANEFEVIFTVIYARTFTRDELLGVADEED